VSGYVHAGYNDAAAGLISWSAMLWDPSSLVPNGLSNRSLLPPLEPCCARRSEVLPIKR
jgi:hypothetical protein